VVVFLLQRPDFAGRWFEHCNICNILLKINKDCVSFLSPVPCDPIIVLYFVLSPYVKVILFIWRWNFSVYCVSDPPVMGSAAARAGQEPRTVELNS